MKKLKSYLLITLSVCMLSSCLDKYPQDEIPADSAITTIEEANQAVIGIYSAWLSGALYSGYLTLLPDLQAPMAVVMLSTRVPNTASASMMPQNHQTG